MVSIFITANQVGDPGIPEINEHKDLTMCDLTMCDLLVSD